MNLRQYWYVGPLLLAALAVNENLVQWILAVRVGGLGVAAGLEDAFAHFSVPGYGFFTALRLLPYVGLGLTLFLLARTRYRGYVAPVFVGGLAGILAFVVWASWMTLRPLYTDEPVSSTTALAFLFIPFYACFTGALGAALAALLYAPLRYLMRSRRRTESD